jgi:hypothetical protein
MICASFLLRYINANTFCLAYLLRVTDSRSNQKLTNRPPRSRPEPKRPGRHEFTLILGGIPTFSKPLD